MRRRPIIITGAIIAAALAVSGSAGASGESTPPKTVSCTLELFAQGPPNLGVSPSGIQFGLVACPPPFGSGVHYDAYTVTPTGPGHGTVTGSFKNYFDLGTRSGTFALTFAATSPTNITYTGTVTYTGGTGAFEHLKGSGTIQCTSTDGGAHKSCTVTSTTTKA
jgi:hypothetical protein